MTKKVSVAILGSTGYVGIELIKILNKHPNVEIVFLGTENNPNTSFKKFDNSINNNELPLTRLNEDFNYKDAQTENVLENKAFEIERIYLLKTFQNMGYGKQLFKKTVSIGKLKGYRRLWLGVWEHNLQAIKFYTKLKLKIFDKHDFILGNDIQTDFLMKFDF